MHASQQPNIHSSLCQLETLHSVQCGPCLKGRFKQAAGTMMAFAAPCSSILAVSEYAVPFCS